VRWNVAPNARPPLAVSGRGVEKAGRGLPKRKALRPHRLKPVPLKRAGEEVKKEASFYAGVSRVEDKPLRFSEDFSTFLSVVSRKYFYTGKLSFSAFVIFLVCRVCVIPSGGRPRSTSLQGRLRRGINLERFSKGSCNGHHR